MGIAVIAYMRIGLTRMNMAECIVRVGMEVITTHRTGMDVFTIEEANV